MRQFDKVTAFVTRVHEGRIQLLVFAHPTAGVQLPAGSVEVGEQPASGAVREVAEETGLTGCVVVTRLGELTQTLPSTRTVLLRAVEVRSQPNAGAPVTATLRRGLPVRADHGEGSWRHVVYETFDLNQEPPVPLTRVAGWVPVHCLAERLVRHLYHLQCTSSTPDRWEQFADDHLFRPFWTPLEAPVALVEGQQQWLDAIHLDLIRSAQELYGPPE